MLTLKVKKALDKYDGSATTQATSGSGFGAVNTKTTSLPSGKSYDCELAYAKFDCNPPYCEFRFLFTQEATLY
jgi:hypothetical protein